MNQTSKIQLVNLKREYSCVKKDITLALKDCLATQSWILSNKVSQFEEKCAKYLGVKYALGVNSGTDALILALRGLAIKKKKTEYFRKNCEIITTPFTFAATAEAIVRSGAKPVFVDVDPQTFNIDPDEIKRSITKKTVGIVPVHLFGLPAPIKEINKIASSHNLFVVEDAAQAFGSKVGNKKSGSLCNAAAFSFFPSKTLGCYGDGGLISTQDKALYELLLMLRNHGQPKTYDYNHIGYNSRLDSIQAAVLLTKLKYIDAWNKKRIAIAQSYNRAFKSIKEISFAVCPKDVHHVYNLYTIKTLKRDKLKSFLSTKGVDSRVYYPKILSEMKAYSRFKVNGSLKNSRSLQSQVLSLPLHPFLKKDEINRVIKAVQAFFN